MKVDEMPVLIVKIEEPVISGDNTFVGQTIYCKCLVKGAPVAADFWQLTSGGEYATINTNGRIDVNEGVTGQSITIQCMYQGDVVEKTITISYGNQLEIDCLDQLVGTSATVVARMNGLVVSPTWSILSGNEHASIDSNGTLTILDSGSVEIQAEYIGLTATKMVRLKYDSDTTSRTIVNEDGSVTGISQVVMVNSDGSTTTNTTSLTTTEEGSTYRSTSTSTVELDGSSTSTTTKYDLNGDPTEVVNQSVDVDGNSQTQNIAYDESGEPVVMGYSIDTSESQTGSKEFDASGVNTQFYGFDSVDGFTLNIHFTIDFTNQPQNQDQGHHQILTMKRADPEPWYGLQLRQSNQSKYIQLGTQFE